MRDKKKRPPVSLSEVIEEVGLLCNVSLEMNKRLTNVEEATVQLQSILIKFQEQLVSILGKAENNGSTRKEQSEQQRPTIEPS